MLLDELVQLLTAQKLADLLVAIRRLLVLLAGHAEGLEQGPLHQLETYAYVYCGARDVSLLAARGALGFKYLIRETVVKPALRAFGQQSGFDDSFTNQVPVPQGTPGSQEAHISGPAVQVRIRFKFISNDHALGRRCAPDHSLQDELSWGGVKALSGCEWPSLKELYIYNTELGSEGIRMMLSLTAASINQIIVGISFDYLDESIEKDEIESFSVQMKLGHASFRKFIQW